MTATHGPFLGVVTGDTIKGERLVCEFRKLRGPWLVGGATGRHRGQRAGLEGLPASAVIEKPVRLLRP